MSALKKLFPKTNIKKSDNVIELGIIDTPVINDIQLGTNGTRREKLQFIRQCRNSGIDVRFTKHDGLFLIKGDK